MKPPRFDGATPWNAYRRQFEAAAIANGWSSTEKATALTLALRGDATAILQRKSLEEQEVYEQLVGNLAMRYGQSHLEHVCHTQLKNRSQKPGESLQEFEPHIARLTTEEGTNRKIFYLVTKKASYQKPNYEDVWNALCSLREVLLAEDLRKLAIPKLACGLDNLDWRIIRSMLEMYYPSIIFSCMVLMVLGFPQDSDDYELAASQGNE
ncbi:unnamed protein product [Acanthoscelides obtectus]|uniref:Uncharacterized protein n=1 Tax=Acanthoscelides obtectus TaxID=200917 RepID=A0A9P0KLE3_ACAOB|nr:unnamed protein product [Acanthoscelides obtectus]CAK1623741.1 O-acetyl-ADP-ribose deacetylase 1 [Acanthoscelides obtectus]